MTTALVKQEGKQTLATTLDRMRPYLLAVLPKHLDPDRMLKLALLASQKQPLLKQCSLESVARSVMHVAQLGLEIGRTAHLVPFKNYKTGTYEAQMIPDYTGLIDLAERSGRVVCVDANVVYADDHFVYEEGTAKRIEHRPNLNGDRTPGSIIAAYAVATRPNGEKQFRVVPRAEIDATRHRSRAKDSGPWVTDYAAMAMKTAVKRLAKYLPQSPELSAAVELDNRFESGEIGTVSALLDTEESVAEAQPAPKQGRKALREVVGVESTEADNLALDREIVEREGGDEK